jgi:hypothetical protein
MCIYLWMYKQMLSAVWRKNISCNRTRRRASPQTIMGYGTSFQFVTNRLTRLSFLAHSLTSSSRTECWSSVFPVPSLW